MSMEVVVDQKFVDGNYRPKTEVKVSCERGSIVELLTFVCMYLV